MSENYTSLRVEMLGGFTIMSNGRIITESVKKSSKVWKLIQYLVAHRDRAVSQEELLDVFCSDEKKGNSGSVLRTMIYRARTLLAESGLECADKIITAKSGCYSWNSSIECSTDVEELEDYAKKAVLCGDEDEKLAFLLKVSELYKGDFLQGFSGDMWVLPLIRGYRNIYINAVHEALDILMKKEQYTDAEYIAARALRIDQFDERLILSYLRTLMMQKKNTEALGVYKKMESMFFDELGVDFSEELHSLYNEISRAEGSVDTPLDDVVMRWLSDVDTSRVYCCDSSDFKVLCQIEARSAHRSGHTTYIVRFNTKHDPNSKDVAKGGGVMKNLEDAIAGSLRTSDIYTRFGPSQYMVMLRSLTYEDCKMLVSKVLGKVDSKYLPKITETSIMHVTPTGEYVQVRN